MKGLQAQEEVLYEYFNAAFREKVDTYGATRMARAVAELRRLTRVAEEWFRFGHVVEGSVVAAEQNPQSPPKLEDLDAPLTPVPGDIPSPLDRPTGCVFHTRCQEISGDVCKQQIPINSFDSSNHQVACHLATQEKSA